MIFSFVSIGVADVAETRAFPAVLAGHVQRVAPMLAQGQMHAPSETVVSVRLQNAFLAIPYRVYYDAKRVLAALDEPGEAGVIAQCLGSRHHDGSIREVCLRRLLASEPDWAVPFIVQLLGEYVIEIVEPIHERFEQGIEAKYVDFFRLDPHHCHVLEQRAISYWNAYYRHRFATHRDYPAVQALAMLKHAAQREDG
ncbi:hypothetical protein HH212_19005 [Massilia forsythiae]|uniref:Uncharacterized protein n=1 Tax=Massilia forsythiae TaxID=2728020 RepID=A0A7Z2VYM2_9BURK|nr:hypothetical protein [Massilia forsythiae]QJE01853.1 hypothetical protein HH212_19005 [Massilia forsythiae]